MLSSKDLLLSVGQKMSATILRIKYEVSICGWRDKEFVLADLPVVKGGLFRAAPNTGIHVRFVKDGQAVSFVSRIIVTNPQPPSYMLFEFPESLEKDNMRMYERYKCKIPIVYKTSKGVSNEGSILDISQGGALMAHVGALAKDDKIFITADIKALNLKLELMEAKVQNIREYSGRKKGHHASGVMFAGITDKNLVALQKLIEVQAMGAKS